MHYLLFNFSTIKHLKFNSTTVAGKINQIYISFVSSFPLPFILSSTNKRTKLGSTPNTKNIFLTNSYR